MSSVKNYTGLILSGSIGAVILIAFLLWFLPVYGVWSAGQSGEAALSHANYERQVQVVNAEANLAAQRYNAESEVIRAGGVAKANNIIKTTLSTEYLQYLWIQTLSDNKNQIIYVPENANGLPFTEAGRALAAPTVVK
jgi:hypothetical protein